MAGNAIYAPRLTSDKTIRFHLFLDAASVELFADGGATVMTEIFFPSQPFNRVKLYVEKGNGEMVKGEMFPLKRIWE